MKILDFIHMIYLFLPFVILIIKSKFLIKYSIPLKILFLIYFLTPLHWVFLDNKCIFTIISLKTGSIEHTENPGTAFTENNLKCIYQPIMKLVNLKWSNNTHITYMIYIHWIVLFIIIWYILSFKM